MATKVFTWRSAPFSRAAWESEIGDGFDLPLLGRVSIDPSSLRIDDGADFGLLAPTVNDPAFIEAAERLIRVWRPVDRDGRIAWVAVSIDPDGARLSVFDDEPDVAPAENVALIADPVGEDGALPVATVWRLSGKTIIVPGLWEGLGDGPLVKSEYGPIPPGARWITVHPHGEGTKGQPVLVVPVKGEKGAYRVIGGAGGRLNMLKLRGVRDPSEYAKEAKEKAAKRREERRRQIEKEKEEGTYEQKQAARESVRRQRFEAEREFVKHVAQSLGWALPSGYLDDEATTEATTENATKGGDAGDKKRMHARLLAAAIKAVRKQRDMLVADADRLTGVLSAQDGDSALELSDLDPVRPKEGGSVNHAWGARASASGLTQEAKAAKVAEAKGQPLEPKEKEPQEQKAPQDDPLAGINLDAGGPLSIEKTASLLKSLKKLRLVQKEARDALGKIDRDAEPKAYVIRVDDDVADEGAIDDLAEAARVRTNAAFLDAVEKSGGEQSLESHVATGAHAFFDEASQIIGGRPLIDRSLVDALGVAGAARVIAWRLHNDLGSEKAREIGEALQKRHAVEIEKRLQAAMEKAERLHKEAEDAAEALDGGIAGHDEITAAFALNRKRQQALADARRELGQALGEAEASAALALALKEDRPKALQLSLGSAALDQAVVRLSALGLRPEDYRLEKVGDGAIAHLGVSALSRLSQSVDPEEVDRLERNRRIIEGAEDEPGWLPEGFARRSDLDEEIKPGVAHALAEPMDWENPDRVQALKDYIGLRYADGHSPSDILADLQSSTFLKLSGDPHAYVKALDAVLPLRKENGKLRRIEELAPLMQQYADEALKARYGDASSSLNRQRLADDDVVREAVFRALAAVPEAKVAYKQIGELTHEDRRVLRKFFAKHVARESERQAELREKVETLKKSEPDRYVTDMFGEQMENPLWQQWRADLDHAVAEWNASGLSWPRYVQIMGGRKRAYRALQDLIRGRYCKAFADEHNRLRSDNPLRVGKTVISDNIRHLDAIDPKAREQRLAEHRALIDALRARVKGKYAAGAVSDKLDEILANRAAYKQAQMSFFAAEEMGEPKDDELRPDERFTLGHAVENQLAAMVRTTGRQLAAGKPVRLFNPDFSGKDGAKRQRMIKLLAANKRLIAAAGVGSGKTAIGLGGFTHLHAAGKVKKGLFVVPSVVQGQFDAEALRFLEPDRYRWHAKPGASFEERLAAYKDPDTHFAVVTHQSFRDDVIRMAALRDGVAPADVVKKLSRMSREERAAYVRDVLAHHGISFDYVMADEAHNLLDRDGKEDSLLSHVVTAVTDNAPYYLHASADPVKNDLSEVYSLLSKIDPKRYADKGAFMRRFGGDTKASREALRRELLRYGYSMALRPDVPVSRQEVRVPLSDGQKAVIKEIDRAAAALRLARMQGKTDIEAARKLSPHSFDGVPESDHEKVAKDLARSIGMVRRAAVRRVIDEHPESAKLAKLGEIAEARKGQQGVVFARSLAAVDAIKKHLQAKGLRVGTITGRDSAEQKNAVIRGFNPDKGDPEFDVVVASDAGAVGANLQSGRWLVQYDTPDTAMVHAQRQGRIYRIGQKGPVDLIDLVADHEDEHRARKRLAEKYDLREMLTSPMEGIDDSGLAWWLTQKQQQGELF